nr:NAD(P)H-dependent oxidoreductase [Bradyrhizobium sp. CCBAU 51745]
MSKGFLEQIFRPGFARERHFPRRLLTGRSDRIVVTMGMPAAVYCW